MHTHIQILTNANHAMEGVITTVLILMAAISVLVIMDMLLKMTVLVALVR